MGWEDEAARVAQTDQDQAGQLHIARTVRLHYLALLQEGFTKREALELAKTYLYGIIAAGVQMKKGRDS